MSLPLTAHMLAAAYDFLRECPPYKGWRLPHSDDIAFHVVRDQTLYGYVHRKAPGATPNIGVSVAGVGHTDTLLRVMGHEMIHLYQDIKKTETAGTIHNSQFRRLACTACAAHGWDSKLFFF